MEGISLRDASEQLDIPANTLRRWWNQLLSKGYSPEVENEGKRILLGDTDIHALQSLKVLYNALTLEEACEWVVLRFGNQAGSVPGTASELLDVKLEVSLMDQELLQLDSNLYWQGKQKTIQHLLSVWEGLKQKLQKGSETIETENTA
ncbi:hypothetical protein FHR92_002977 [Fontibacillus solani]|uniref:HTH merR-type domain-containing protein n=1 Tax=Fontibacillus solani TaxID=1572857 RepID=A0A7W3SUM4_9BACL|nr:hypothetical protein [Fontibacillus solani]MBA9086499.1 hypothetical protein [Fontibacillus solani]